MTAYVVTVVHEVTDPAALQDYRALALPTVDPTVATLLVGRGETTTVEGGPAVGVGVVAFPDRAAAEAWYHSPGYQRAAARRLEGSRCTTLIVDGVAGDDPSGARGWTGG